MSSTPSDEKNSNSYSILSNTMAPHDIAPLSNFINVAELPTYERLRRPYLHFVILLFPLFFLVPLAINMPHYRAIIDDSTNNHSIGMTLFLCNIYIFACFWLIYFASGWGWRITECQSLRTLLKHHSAQWLTPDHNDQHAQDISSLISTRLEKARTTMTTQAVFIAITVFIINNIAGNQTLKGGKDVAFLDYCTALAALSAAVCSFTLLFISTDAAETMFNKFAKVREDIAVHNLYSTSVRLKYYGFVLCFLSLSMLVSTLNPFIAALATALFLFSGYTYWYPDASNDRKYRTESTIFRIVLLLINAYIIFHVF